MCSFDVLHISVVKHLVIVGCQIHHHLVYQQLLFILSCDVVEINLTLWSSVVCYIIFTTSFVNGPGDRS